ncbi:unnamed protein product [marine sediment metagenome]|uniref:Uncharacterized protein n=1 Tax=marine sediment metagenome TaxID=412755 RepID=X1FJI2_9ZZZZ
MGKDIDFTGIAILLGLGYLVYKMEAFKMPEIPGLPTWPTFKWPTFKWPSPPIPMMPEPTYVYRPIPTIIDEAARGWKINGYVTPEPDELYGASRRGWLTAKDITTSERLAYEAQKAGVTDF